MFVCKPWSHSNIKNACFFVNPGLPEATKRNFVCSARVPCLHLSRPEIDCNREGGNKDEQKATAHVKCFFPKACVPRIRQISIATGRGGLQRLPNLFECFEWGFGEIENVHRQNPQRLREAFRAQPGISGLGWNDRWSKLSVETLGEPFFGTYTCTLYTFYKRLTLNLKPQTLSP